MLLEQIPNQQAPRSFFLDLVDNDLGEFDLGDFQMLILTLLAVGMYLVTPFNFLATIESLKAVSLPDVDTTILATFGLDQWIISSKGSRKLWYELTATISTPVGRI
jgi:hypothetical protein